MHEAAVIEYLVEENRILKEQLESEGKRLRFTDDQRPSWDENRWSEHSPSMRLTITMSGAIKASETR